MKQLEVEHESDKIIRKRLDLIRTRTTIHIVQSQMSISRWLDGWALDYIEPLA